MKLDKTEVYTGLSGRETIQQNELMPKINFARPVLTNRNPMLGWDNDIPQLPMYNDLHNVSMWSKSINAKALGNNITQIEIKKQQPALKPKYIGRTDNSLPILENFDHF